MRKKLFFLSFLFGIITISQAQQNKISATLIDSISKIPIEGINVSLLPQNKSTVTNENGQFTFIQDSHQVSSIEFSGIGFEKKSISISEFKSGASIVLVSKIASLEEVVIHSGNVTSQYSPISKLDIKLRAVNNSQEVLRIVPGLFIGQHQGGGKAEQIFIRGFDCDHGTDINLNVDGIPINLVSHAHGQGYADAHFIIPETIESLNFKKGTYYAEKGNFDTAGFVDFKTANSIPQNLIKIEGGMYNSLRIVGMFNLLSNNAKTKNQSWYVASEYNYSDGFFDYPQNFNRFNIFTKYNGKVSENSFLQIAASTMQSKWNASGQIPEELSTKEFVGFYGALDPTEGGETSRTNLNTQLLTTLKNGAVIKNQFIYSNYNFDLFTNFTFYLNDPINGDQIRQKESRNLWVYNGSFKHVRYLDKIKVITDAGINFRWDKTNNSELSHTVDRYTVIDPIKLGDISESNAALFVSETFQFNDKWSINAGLRFDQFYNRYYNKLATDTTLSGVGLYKADANIVSPKFSLHLQANTKTQFYLSAGRGFHSNDTRAVVVTNGEQILPPVYGVDLGTVFKPTSNLLLHFATWYMNVKQEFVYSGDGGIVEITGETNRIGLDFSTRYEPITSVFIDIDLNYAHGRYADEPEGQNLIPLAPIWSSTGGITYKNNTGFQWRSALSLSFRQASY